MSVYNVLNKQIVQLECGDEEAIKPEKSIAEYVIVKNMVSVTEPWWGTFGEKYSLMSLRDGSRKTILRFNNNQLFSFSPDGKYLAYYDTLRSCYFSLRVRIRGKANISNHVPTKLGRDVKVDSLPSILILPDGIAGLLKNDISLMVYDYHDIWLLDPTNRKPPINITNAYGRKNGVQLRLLNEESIKSKGDTLLMTGFNLASKSNGFYYSILGKNADPVLLSVNELYTYTNRSQSSISSNMSPFESQRCRQMDSKAPAR